MIWARFCSGVIMVNFVADSGKRITFSGKRTLRVKST